MLAALGLLGFAFASALVPVLNIEAYLVGMGALGEDRVWLMALVAGTGQMLGKLVWYQLGASSLRWAWVRRRMEKPKARQQLERWRTRTADRPLVTAALLFVSAVTGFPPFAIVAVLAGQLRMNLAIFVAAGTLGRTLRFAAFLGSAGWLTRLVA